MLCADDCMQVDNACRCSSLLSGSKNTSAHSPFSCLCMTFAQLYSKRRHLSAFQRVSMISYIANFHGVILLCRLNSWWYCEPACAALIWRCFWWDKSDDERTLPPALRWMHEWRKSKGERHHCTSVAQKRDTWAPVSGVHGSSKGQTKGHTSLVLRASSVASIS